MFELICLTMVVLNTFGGNYVLSAQDACSASFQCGGLSISYPFWSLGDNHSYCGYHGLGVNCSTGKPILSVLGRSYWVKTINYTDNSLSCGPGLNDGTLCSSFTNCSPDPKSKLYVSCLDDAGTNRSYFLTQDPGYMNCEERIRIPVVSKVTNISNLSTYASVLQEGFQLAWFSYGGDEQCESCEYSSGGRCRYSPLGSDNLVCVCPSGRIAANGSNCLRDLCEPFQCGKNGLNFSYPFWSIVESLGDRYCGNEGLGVNCSDGKPILTVGSQPYVVKSINYTYRTLTAMSLDFLKEPCASAINSRSVETTTVRMDTYLSVKEFGKDVLCFNRNCLSYPKSRLDVSCIDSTGTNLSYFVTQVPESDSPYKCEEVVEIPVVEQAAKVSNRSTYASVMQGGFPFVWDYTVDSECYRCQISGGRCLYFQASNSYSRCVCPNFIADDDCDGGVRWKKKVMIGVLTGVGPLVLIVIFAYRCARGRSNKKSNKNVEVFLENYGLHRFKYSDLKKLTNCFKDKLGQGGYGGVFKGKLKDGSFIAVKLLNDSKGKGEDFINEVATIGRTNHINIVSLLGFCSEGSKRALVYEYMPNGSLEKFIYNKISTSATHHPLGEEKIYQIALGIANGLEYLHRGCSTRILHFDIKPHNILLDKDFCPKISDFGLAKLCLTRESVVSMHVPRGTMGYIAPEVYCRNFGGVSPKSDVYSYGMMVLEMVGGRKNIDATVDNTSEIYFPLWIYNHLVKNEHNGLGELKDDFEEESIKKMVIVGLWCIQTHPADRPSMSMVVEMLQKNVDDLQMPPNPSIDPRTSSQEPA